MAGSELCGWGENDSVQGNKQATVATLRSLNLGQYKSQDLKVYSYVLGYTVSHAELATGILLRTTACYSYTYTYTGVPDVQYV